MHRSVVALLLSLVMTPFLAALTYQFVEGREAVNFSDGRSPESLVKAIARQCYGDERYWFHIWQANRDLLYRCVAEGLSQGQTVTIEVPPLVRQDVVGIVPPTAVTGSGRRTEVSQAAGSGLSLLGTSTAAVQGAVPSSTDGAGSTKTLSGAELSQARAATTLQAALQILARALGGDSSQASQLWSANRSTLSAWWTTGGSGNGADGLTLTIPGNTVTTATKSADTVRQRIIQSAMTWTGIPYRYGGTSRRGVDCSGFVYRVFRDEGIELPRTTGEMLGVGSAIRPETLAPGDLMFFRGGGHVGLYLGDGQYIHAPYTGTVVQISTVATRSDVYACRRVL